MDRAILPGVLSYSWSSSYSKESRLPVGRLLWGTTSKKGGNSARNRKTLQEKAQNLNEPVILPVYIYG